MAALAERIDNGTLTPAGADAEMAKTVANTNGESQRRNAAMWDAMPRAVTCTSAGATTTCY